MYPMGWIRNCLTIGTRPLTIGPQQLTICSQTRGYALMMMTATTRTTTTPSRQSPNHPIMTPFIPSELFTAKRMANLINPLINIEQRGIKSKGTLDLRCDDCYFTKVDGFWMVLCKTHPRHKQKETIGDKRQFWIVSYKSSGGRPWKKHYQFRSHQL